MFDKYNYFLIVDLESTCCDDGSIPKGKGEIIEIGAVMMDSKTMEVVDEFNAFIQPEKYPVLTDFCTELTTITQDNVNGASKYPVVSQELSNWLKGFDNYVFCSWGNYDKNHLALESLKYQVVNPIQAPHINVKKVFATEQRIKPVGMKSALTLCQIELVGTHHRGIDDARNIGKLMPYVLGNLSI